MPVIGYTKKDMYTEAAEYKYEDILNLTWSCWYPRKGKPCGKCIMCRERYIPNLNQIEPVKAGEIVEPEMTVAVAVAVAIAIAIAVAVAIAILLKN